MFHVLEYIPDPRSMKVKLSNLWAVNGKIIVEVPNVDDALLPVTIIVPFRIFYVPKSF